ncbi:unnamed protein product, partial [Mesorhabditis belari]|uniref:Methyltransferase domain-containing protein n=1 Tax=Mesorhabditis belari TaxID=2138241 RepID=A0AAF3F9Q6_9BILA
MRPNVAPALLFFAVLSIFCYLLYSNAREGCLDAWSDKVFLQDYVLTKKHYVETAKERTNLLRDVLLQKRTKTWRFADIYNGLVPEVFCTSLLRVGKVSDGGKWICRPWSMPNDCAVYSLGVNQDTSFERDLQSLTQSRCRLYAYDKNQPKSAKVLEGLDKMNVHFKKGLIGIVNDPENGKLSIQEEMKLYKDKRVEILKIDIEGAELKVLPELINAARICQILVEIHADPHLVLDLMKKLAKGGYRLFSYEINEQYNVLPFENYLENL